MEEIQDGQADSSTVVGEQEPADIAGEGAASHEDQAVPFSEHPRWKEVYGDLKEFKTLGELNDIKAKLERLDYYDQMVAEVRANRAGTREPVSDEERDLKDQREKAREQLYQIAPELRELISLGELSKQQAMIQQRATEMQAEEALGDVLKTAGIPATEAAVKKYGTYLVNIIGTDQKLYAKYLSHPEAAVKEAWRRYTEDAVPLSRSKLAATQQKGAALNALPRAGQGGVSGGTGGPAAPPQSLDELFKQHRGALTGKE